MSELSRARRELNVQMRLKVKCHDYFKQKLGSVLPNINKEKLIYQRCSYYKLLLDTFIVRHRSGECRLSYLALVCSTRVRQRN